jgi:hypothetical protein
MGKWMLTRCRAWWDWITGILVTIHECNAERRWQVSSNRCTVAMRIHSAVIALARFRGAGKRKAADSDGY